MIRVDALWLSVEPLDMRAGTEAALRRVVTVFGAARPHHAYLFANALLATLVYEHVSEVITAFGEKGVTSEQVAREVVREGRAYQVSHAALGPHLTDQWVLPLALAVWQRRRSASYTATELTDHATTNFETIQKFLPVDIQTERAGEGWRVCVNPG